MKNLPPEKHKELEQLLLKNTPAELALKVLQLTHQLKTSSDLLVELNGQLGNKDEQIASLLAKAAINNARS